MKISPTRHRFPPDFIEWAAQVDRRHRSFKCEAISESGCVVTFQPPCRSRLNTKPVGSSYSVSPWPPLVVPHWRTVMAQVIRRLRRQVSLQIPGPRLAQRPSGTVSYPKIGRREPL